jgi:hypothetical protein
MPFKLSWRSIAKHYLDYDYITDKPDEITEKVTKFYLGDKPPMRGTASEFGDVIFKHNFIKIICDLSAKEAEIFFMDKDADRSVFPFRNQKFSSSSFPNCSNIQLLLQIPQWQIQYGRFFLSSFL